MTDKRFEDLCLLVEQDESTGIYMCGHLTEEQRESFKKNPNDAYRCGWNDAYIHGRASVHTILEKATSGLSEDVRLLLASGYAFSTGGNLSLNMNDTWAWATSWLPEVPDDQVAEVARLFRTYGNAGLLYWHSCQENNMRSEFHDNNRAIDFVRNEEQIRKETPESNARAYRKVSYVIGAETSPHPVPVGDGEVMGL